MPRLPPRLLRAAHRISPHLATLLPACRDLPSARNELRWIREHVTASRGKATATAADAHADAEVDVDVNRLCKRRARGVPLQYVLGSQPFGPLDIRCRPGVLIPRPETEAWACWLAELVAQDGAAAPAAEEVGQEGKEEGEKNILRVVDLCAGSGCVALLLAALLRRRLPGRSLEARGFDVEPRAVRLARENRARNAALLSGEGGQGQGQGAVKIAFERADVFAPEWLEGLLRTATGTRGGGGGGGEGGRIDILVANPPYVSARGFDRDTGRSVRSFEPRLALVPSSAAAAAAAARDHGYRCEPEDVFYARLLDVAGALRPRMAAFEVGGLEQAVRVAGMAGRGRGQGQGRGEAWEADVEIWRDWPDMRPRGDEIRAVRVEGLEREVPVRGSGNGRVVFMRRRT